MIQEISKRALSYFKENGYIFTPLEYQKVFCKEAKKANIILEDCNKLTFLLNKLDKKYQNILEAYKIDSIEELVLFLIDILNKIDKEVDYDFYLYTKRVLQAIQILPTKAKYIAIRHLNILKPHITKDELNHLRHDWIEFITTYDDSILKKYQNICNIKISDIEDIDKVIDCLYLNKNIKKLIEAISVILDDDMKQYIYNDPSFITSNKFIEYLKTNISNKKYNILSEDDILNFLDIQERDFLLENRNYVVFKIDKNKKLLKLINDYSKKIDRLGVYKNSIILVSSNTTKEEGILLINKIEKILNTILHISLISRDEVDNISQLLKQI